MRIADLNLRITFQKMSVVADKYGNHTNAYKDYFSCYATASGSGNHRRQTALDSSPAILCADRPTYGKNRRQTCTDRKKDGRQSQKADGFRLSAL